MSEKQIRAARERYLRERSIDAAKYLYDAVEADAQDARRAGIPVQDRDVAFRLSALLAGEAAAS